MRDGDTAVIETDTVAETVHAVTGWAIEHDVDLEGMTVTRPSLEDIYLQLTSEVADGSEPGPTP